MVQKRERLFLNVMKGVLIFLMLWGHCIQYCAQDSFDFFENFVFKAIYSFHMPLFMLISGYLFFFSFRKRDLKTLLIHRTQGMLQPIVFASILNGILIRLPSLVRGKFYVLDGCLLSELYSLWFLWCVLSASIAVAVSCKMMKRNWLQLLGMGAGIFFVVLFPDMNMHLYMYPYFVLGFVYGKYKDCIGEKWKKLKWFSLIIFPIMLLFYEKVHYIYITPVYASGMAMRDVLSINGFRWMIGLVGSIFALTLTDLVFNLLTRDRMPPVLKAVAKLGENSLAIYCLSVSLLSWYLPKIYGRLFVIEGKNLFAENMLGYNFLMTPILTVIYCVGLYTVVCVLKKCKVHNLIFGR